MFEYVIAGAFALLALIVTIFTTLYPKARQSIDKKESHFNAAYAKFLAQAMFDLSKEHQAVYDNVKKQWISSIPTIQDYEKLTKDAIETADALRKDLSQAKKLRDNLDAAVFSLIIAVITFFVAPLLPSQILREIMLITGIGATLIGVIVLFYVVK